jgi:Protein of unknown function (DUF3891)
MELGNRQFPAIENSEGDAADALEAISLHDCGWPLHDDAPTINTKGQPADVFESTPKIAFRVWPASAERAAEKSPYTGLLVSLHVLSLSATTLGNSATSAEPRLRFELNRFQHREIERQEELRRALGMATDRPLHLGLSEDVTDAREQRLTYHFRLLQALDRLSLNLCCAKPPNPRIEPIIPTPGAVATSLDTRRTAPFQMVIDPWPFGVKQLQVAMPFRRVPNRVYADDDDLRRTLAGASIESVGMTLLPASVTAVGSR